MINDRSPDGDCRAFLSISLSFRVHARTLLLTLWLAYEFLAPLQTDRFRAGLNSGDMVSVGQRGRERRVACDAHGRWTAAHEFTRLPRNHGRRAASQERRGLEETSCLDYRRHAIHHGPAARPRKAMCSRSENRGRGELRVLRAPFDRSEEHTST